MWSSVEIKTAYAIQLLTLLPDHWTSIQNRIILKSLKLMKTPKPWRLACIEPRKPNVSQRYD